MKEVIRKYFIPHKGNDFIPHFFREHIVAGFAAFLLLIFALSFAYNGVILADYNFLAEVLPPALVGLANDDRLNNNLPELKVNPVLVLAAKFKAEDMAAKSYFSHTSPEGITPWFWFGKAGYSFLNAGENLAVDFSESVDVNSAWMKSTGHRANILNKNFTEIGIATAKGFYQGHETTFVVQLFGRPLPVFPVSPEPLPKTNPQPTNIPKAIPTPTPQVAGDDVQIVAVNDAENELYIEVKNNEPIVQNSEPTVIKRSLSDKFTGFERKVDGILSSPNESLAYIYMILGAFVMLALIIMIAVEIKYQHPRHIMYGLLLLLLIGGLIYLNLYVLSSNVVVI